MTNPQTVVVEQQMPQGTVLVAESGAVVVVSPEPGVSVVEVSGNQGPQGLQGPTGPQGNQGVPGAATGSFSVQFQSAASVVHVNHNLGSYPVVFVLDVNGNTLLGDIVYVDTNNLTVTFSNLETGTVYCN